MLYSTPDVDLTYLDDSQLGVAALEKLATARTVTVAGENSTGNAAFDGSGNVTINTSRSFTESSDIAGPNGITFHFYQYGDEVVIAAGFRPKYEALVPGIRDDDSGML